MCKLAYIRTRDDSSYQRAIDMIKFQENNVAGQSTGLTFRTSSGFSTRKAIGKTNSFLSKYPNIPNSNEVLAHSRWATVGIINLDNQHPISVMYKDKKIGYAIHNGRFDDYESFEHYRREGMVNKTDSALLFSIFSRALEQMGDSKENRRKAFALTIDLIKHESNHNLIFMFKDGQVLFGGNVLSYNSTPEKVGIMTFGFDNLVEEGFVYELNGFKINRFNIRIPNLNIVKKPKKKLVAPKSQHKHFRQMSFKNGVLQR